MRLRSLLLLVAAVLGSYSLSVSGQTLSPENLSSERAVFFSGQVAMEDGTAPPDPVLIQQVCPGRTRDVAWSDSKGRFGFKVDGGKDESHDDASAPPSQPADFGKPLGSSTVYTNPVTSSLRDCEVQAVLAGFRSERVSISIKNTLDNSHIGTIILHPNSRGSTLTISATSLNVPAKAKKAYLKGLAESKAQSWEEAGRDFHKAVTEYPGYAAAWYELGKVRQIQNDAPGAVEAWKRALTVDPKYVRPYDALTTLSYRRENWHDLDQYSAEWIRLDPRDFPVAYLFQSFAAAKLGRSDDALNAAREGVRIDKDHSTPKLNYVLALLLLARHDSGEAARYFHLYLEQSPNAPETAAIREQLSKLEAPAQP